MKYKYENIERKPEKEYKPEKIIKKEDLQAWKDKVHIKVHKKEKESTVQTSQKLFDRKHTFEWELFQWADYDFVNWANSQPETMLMAVMAEMKKSPKMKPSIEQLRSQVKDVPLYSIEEYRQKKRLGERSVSFLKEMKRRYGNSVLRILYLTSES
jgi:hypothetical protein